MAAPQRLEERFGRYGGRYVPETLMPALAALEQAWLEAREDARFRAELGGLLATYVGRPTPLYHARRLSDRVGADVYLKREDLLHTGAHKINNALGQALLARRMGKRRVIAETGAGSTEWRPPPPVRCSARSASCTWAPRHAPAAAERRAHGAARRPGRAGRSRRAHVEGGRERGDPRLGRERRDDPLRDRVGGRPGALSGAGPGPPARDRRRGPRPDPRPDRIAARPSGRLRGGGSNAIGTFTAFAGDEDVEIVGVEAGGEGLDGTRHGASLAAGREGVLHGAFSSVLQDEDGQIVEAHSISAGLDYPGVGPEHAHLRDTGRVRYEAVTDAAALRAFRELSRLEGSSRRSSPRMRSRGCWRHRSRTTERPL